MLIFVNLPIASAGSSGLKAFLSIIPQVTAQQMAAIWGAFDQSQIAINSTTAKEIINNYSFREGLIFLPVGLLVWALMGFYLDAVLPKEYGTKRHPCFMFFPSTYMGCCKKGADVQEDDET
jgi:hypothetical protein